MAGMKVHHLDCGTMRPPFLREGVVCHVLLVELADRLVLVDSGFGLADAAQPARRIGPSRHVMRPIHMSAQAAVHQVARLGHDPRDVRDIVLTHLDADHVGGAADLPWARLHVTAAEHRAARHPRTSTERRRYLPAALEHGPEVVEHTPDGDPWRGIGAAQEILPGIALIALPGHSRGHAAVAVDAGTHWVLHVGDAFYHRAQVDGSPRGPVNAVPLVERMIATDRAQVRDNHARLAELWAREEPDLMMVNAHDTELLRRARRRVASTT